MVNKPVVPLLSLALTTLEWAKTLFVFRLLSHCGLLGCTVLTAIAIHLHWPESYEIIFALAAVVFEGGALFFHHLGLERHGLGRQGMRRVMLIDSLHPQDALELAGIFRQHFSAGLQRKAAAKEAAQPDYLANYYWSNKAGGPERLRDHLYESAIFSHQLYGAAWKFSLTCLISFFILATLIAIAIFAFHIAEVDRVGTMIGRIVIVLVSFLPACQELDHLMLYRLAEEQLSELLKNVEALYAEPIGHDQLSFHRLLADFGDYSAATTFAPPIRSLVYWQHADTLRIDFAKRMVTLGQDAKTPAP